MEITIDIFYNNFKNFSGYGSRCIFFIIKT